MKGDTVMTAEFQMIAFVLFTGIIPWIVMFLWFYRPEISLASNLKLNHQSRWNIMTMVSCNLLSWLFVGSFFLVRADS